MSRRILSLILAAIIAGSLLFATLGTAPAEAKVVTKRGIAIDVKKNAMAVKCKKKGQYFRTIRVFHVCPKKGWFAYMRSGESFSPEDTAHWKFYPTKKKALKASSRSAQNKYLTKRFY